MSSAVPKLRQIRVAGNTQPHYVHRSSARKQRIVDQQRRLEIGERIKRFRGQMRQHQAAEKMHVSVRTWQAWELGETATDLDNYERMAKLFGVSVREILGDESGEPLWVGDLRAELVAVREELQELREAIGQAFVGRALLAEDRERAEGRAEAESQARPKRSRRGAG